MTPKETGTIMDILTGAYPRFYPRGGDVTSQIKVWAEMFRDDPVEMVAIAVKTLIATDEKGYPPHIGAVKAKMRQLMEPETMTEMEAWGYIKKAMRLGPSMSPSSRRIVNGTPDDRTSAQRAFEGLPPIIQKIVGGPEQLAAWYLIPTDELETVVQSNFMRSYRTRVKQEQDYAAIPADVKAAIGPIAKKLSLDKSDQSGG